MFSQSIEKANVGRTLGDCWEMVRSWSGAGRVEVKKMFRRSVLLAKGGRVFLVAASPAFHSCSLIALFNKLAVSFSRLTIFFSVTLLKRISGK